MKKLSLITLAISFAMITSAQNVGIGTTLPEYSLHVKNLTGESSLGVNAAGTASQSLLNLSIDNRIDGNALFFVKYRPGVAGTTSGIPKSNLSALGADFGAGPLLISTNQASHMHFATNATERMRITSDGHVHINNTNTSLGWLHVENNDNSYYGMYSENLATTGSTYSIGARIRGPVGAGIDGVSYTGVGTSTFPTGSYGVMGRSGSTGTAVGAFSLGGGTALRAEITTGTGTAIYSLGKLQFTGISEAPNRVLTSDASGYATWQDLPGSATIWTVNGTHLSNNNTGNVGINIGMSTPTYGKFIVDRNNDFNGALINYTGVVVGLNSSSINGSGVYGISYAPRTGALVYAGVSGYNPSPGTDRFGVIGQSEGTTAGSVYSAGVGGYGDYGVLGLSQSNTGAGIIAQHAAGKTALELNNGFIKVSGTNKTAFIVTANTGTNINLNQVRFSYTGMLSTDILIVTHNYSTNYIGGVGTWWDGTQWTVFREDQAAMPNGEKFNVLVIKQ